MVVVPLSVLLIPLPDEKKKKVSPLHTKQAYPLMTASIQVFRITSKSAGHPCESSVACLFGLNWVQALWVLVLDGMPTVFGHAHKHFPKSNVVLMEVRSYLTSSPAGVLCAGSGLRKADVFIEPEIIQTKQVVCRMKGHRLRMSSNSTFSPFSDSGWSDTGYCFEGCASLRVWLVCFVCGCWTCSQECVQALRKDLPTSAEVRSPRARMGICASSV